MKLNIGLDEKACQEAAKKLELLLADTYVLYTKTQNFHWNIVDPRFYSLHLFLQKQYEEMAEKVDEIAERIRMLGAFAPGGLKQFLEIASLKESTEKKEGNQMLQALLADHSQLCQQLREGIKQIAQMGDEGTADLFIQHLRFHEKSVWMLSSQLKAS